MCSSDIGTQVPLLTDLLQPVSKDVEAAIREFIHQYELQHKVVVLESALEDTTIQVESTPFVSGIVRLNFEYRGRADGNHQGTSSVLVKVPQLSAQYALFNRLKLYEKERYFYKTILPRMYKPWSDREKLTPTLYASTPSNILVLENLNESGFRVRKKGSLLDFTGCKAVLKSLACFHALSMKYLESVDDNLSQLRVVFEENTEEAFRGCSLLMSKLRQYDVVSCLSPEARQRFNEFCTDVNGNVCLGYTPNADGPNIILQGDMHHYNVLFRPGEETTCKLIDFQCCRLGSPIIDLMYFFVTSADVHVFESHKESLFRHYLTVLNDTSEQLGVHTWYSFEHLNADYEKYRLFFVYVITGIVPALWSGEWWDTTVNHGTDVFDSVMSSERYISVFKRWMENFVHS